MLADGMDDSLNVERASRPNRSGPGLRILVAGSIAMDRLERSGTVIHRLGGVAVYGGLTAAHLGGHVDAWSALPSDWRDRVRQRLEPVALHVTASPTATRFVNRETPGRERRQCCPSRARTLQAADLPFPASYRWDWVHLGPLHPDDLAADVAPVLRRRCSVLTLDLQGFSRHIMTDGAVEPATAADFEDRLLGLDWLKASEAEWALAESALHLSPAQAVHRFGWRGLLISAGDRGGVLHTEAGAISWVAARAARVALETGAGDVFTASFVTSLLKNREATSNAPREAELAASLRLAATIAARHVAGEWLDLDGLQLATD